MEKTVDLINSQIQQSFLTTFEEVERLYKVCKKINRLLKKHRNKLVWSSRLLKWEQKFKDKKVKYFLMFKLLAFGKNRDYIENKVLHLINLIQDVESFAVTYEKNIKYAY